MQKNKHKNPVHLLKIDNNKDAIVFQCDQCHRTQIYQMENKSNYSVFEYLYRDASNWKSWGKLLLVGGATSAEYAHMKTKLDTGQFFIPEQIGIPPLSPKPRKSLVEPTSDDHVWHECITLRTATTEEIQNSSHWGTTQSLLDRISAVSQWDITQSQAYEAIYIGFDQEKAILRRSDKNQT